MFFFCYFFYGNRAKVVEIRIIIIVYDVNLQRTCKNKAFKAIITENICIFENYVRSGLIMQKFWLMLITPEATVAAIRFEF